MPANNSPNCSKAPGSTAWRHDREKSCDETHETVDDIIRKNIGTKHIAIESASSSSCSPEFLSCRVTRSLTSQVTSSDPDGMPPSGSFCVWVGDTGSTPRRPQNRGPHVTPRMVSRRCNSDDG